MTVIQILETRMDNYVQLVFFHPLKNELDSVYLSCFEQKTSTQTVG